jgi:hypothetical protein
MDVDLRHLIVRHTDLFRVGSVVESGCYSRIRSRAGAANEPKHDAEVAQRLTCPIDADWTKKAMFHGISFRCACGIMADGDFQAIGVRPVLQFAFPQPTTTAVAAARTGQSHPIDGTASEMVVQFLATATNCLDAPPANGRHEPIAAMSDLPGL